jgi:ABC-2 type transport system ATP-binding protein
MVDSGSPWAVSVRNLSKTYATVRAVDGLSFDVAYGEIFGLLGPNGAGKTSTIRMVLDLIRPDAGDITVLGAPMRESTKRRIGYLPEERGLYEDMTLLDTIVFLARLKGLRRAEALRRAERHLRDLGLWEARRFKIGALSRGMNQKAQFVAATLHEPDLLIIDEPFSGLDPVNARMIRERLYALRDAGTAIIMSSHQMHQVEEMCQRILLLDRGCAVLYGSLKEIHARFSTNAVEMVAHGPLPDLPGIQVTAAPGGAYHVVLPEGLPPEALLGMLCGAPGLAIERFEPAERSLDDIFVQVVGGDGGPPAEGREREHGDEEGLAREASA